jgi:hypothetical protein
MDHSHEEDEDEDEDEDNCREAREMEMPAKSRLKMDHSHADIGSVWNNTDREAREMPATGVVLYIILKRHPPEVAAEDEIVHKVVIEKTYNGDCISNSTTFSFVVNHVDEFVRSIHGEYSELFNITYESKNIKGTVVHTVLMSKENLDALHLSVVPTMVSDGINFKELCMHFRKPCN